MHNNGITFRRCVINVSLYLFIISFLYAGANVWTSTGPGGGLIASLAVDPSDPSILYAGTIGGGAFRSTDGAAHWSRMEELPSYWDFTWQVAVSPTRPSTVFACSDLRVYKSLDRGDHWTCIFISSQWINCFSCDPTDPDTAWVDIPDGLIKIWEGSGSPAWFNPGSSDICSIVIDRQISTLLWVLTTDGMVLKSTDGGENWSEGVTVSEYDQTARLIQDPTDRSVLHYSGVSGISRSTDWGETWGAGAGIKTSISARMMGVDPGNPDILYIVNQEGVFKSSDGGINWIPCGAGIENRDVSVISIETGVPAVLYVGTRFGGVYKSTDAGEHWIETNTGLAASAITALLVDPSTPDTLYAGTDIGDLFTSDDLGISWQRFERCKSYLESFGLAVNPENEADVFAGTAGGFCHSRNGGVDWENDHLSGMGDCIAIDPQNPMNIFRAEYGAGLLKSIDGGQTWENACNGLCGFPLLCVVIDPSLSTTLYVGTESHGIYKTTDAGGNWFSINNGIGDPSAMRVYCLAIQSSAPGVIYSGTDHGVWKTTTGGGHWVALEAGIGNPVTRAITIDPANPAVVYAGTTTGVFRSADGGSIWATANSGLENQDVRTLICLPGPASVLLAGTAAGVCRSEDDGVSWTSIDINQRFPACSVLAAAPGNPATVYLGTKRFGIFRSADSGQSWTPISEGLARYPVSAVELDPNTRTLYVGFGCHEYEYWLGGGLLTSTDGGATWRESGDSIRGGQIQAIEADPSSPGTVYMGVYDEGLFKSVDGGGHWEAANNGLGPGYFFEFQFITVDPWDSQHLLASLDSYGLFQSTDAGASWDQNPGDFSSYPSSSVFDPQNPGVIFLTSGGIFKSSNSGESWEGIYSATTTADDLAIDSMHSAALFAEDHDFNILASRDSGENWSNLQNLSLSAPSCLAVSPTLPVTLFAGSYRSGVLVRLGIPGDLSHDYSIDLADTSCLKAYLCGNPTDPSVSFPEEADFIPDHVINAADLIWLLKQQDPPR